MSVSRSPAPSSIDLSGVPSRVAEAIAQVVAVCHEQFRPDPCPEAFEEAELRVRETMNALACELLGAVIEKRDDGASRIERAELVPGRGDGEDDHDLARSADLPASALPQRRERGIAGAGRREPGPRRRLPDAAGMTPSVSTLQRLTRTMHERWETLGPETLDSIRDAEGVPHEAVSASVALDGVMVPLRAGEDGRAEASWRRGRLRHGFLPRRQGRASEDPLSRSWCSIIPTTGRRGRFRRCAPRLGAGLILPCACKLRRSQL